LAYILKHLETAMYINFLLATRTGDIFIGLFSPVTNKKAKTNSELNFTQSVYPKIGNDDDDDSTLSYVCAADSDNMNVLNTDGIENKIYKWQ
jgi:hypothetical protein